MANIKPLSEDAATRIKSSIVISSLTTVIVGLLENCIDAVSTKIDIHVDFARGSCSAEDDGCGIASEDFREHGGLGKKYHTSRLAEEGSIQNRHGLFLWSIASLSILTVISHRETFNSTNAITFHHSRPVARLLPAPSHMNLANRSHGTRVLVRDLFGNMPVRVRQRPTGDEGEKLRDKQWKFLCRSVTGVFLARGCNVTFTLRDNDGKFLRFRPSNLQATLDGTWSRRTRSFNVEWIKQTLLQANYIDGESQSSWIGTSARANTITVRGVISTQPAPSREVQFLSIGSQNITDEHGYNILFDEINRIFSRSSFGVREESFLATTTRARRDSPSKENLTGKQLKGVGKGVDRWPMFYVRIDINDGTQDGRQAPIVDDKSELTGIMSILAAMINSFLRENNFRTSTRQERHFIENPRSSRISSPRISKAVGQHTPSTSQPNIPGDSCSSEANRNILDNGDLTNNIRFPSKSSVQPEQKNEFFNGWGRIKFGARTDREGQPSSGVSAPTADSDFSSKPLSSRIKTSMKDSPSSSANAAVGHEDIHDVGTSTSGMQDAPTRWTDPISKNTHLIDPRTGFVIDQYKYSESTLKPDRTPSNGSWAASLLASWDNPVFKATESRIPQIDPQDLSMVQLGGTNAEPRLELDSRFKFSLGESRVTKEDLKNAKVIAQVDFKFILVKFDGQEHQAQDEKAGLLMLVDQHAADERIRVEMLLADYLSSPSTGLVRLPKPIVVDLGSRDQVVFQKQQTHFAEWGIMFKVRNSTTSTAAGTRTGKWSLEVTELPEVIAERCRAEPRFLFDLLRDEAWKREDVFPPSGVFKSCTEDWTRRIHNCPQRILDMINSRACRSAIMFNDELSLEECNELLLKLSHCRLPFQCAHGRPSMVPLVNLGTLVQTGESQVESAQVDDFAERWKAWETRS